MVAALGDEHAEQVQGVGVIGLERQGPAVERFGLIGLTGEVELEGGLDQGLGVGHEGSVAGKRSAISGQLSANRLHQSELLCPIADS